jgi:hypothetical protein
MQPLIVEDKFKENEKTENLQKEIIKKGPLLLPKK